jgi:hypothetical protein
MFSSRLPHFDEHRQYRHIYAVDALGEEQTVVEAIFRSG